MTAATLNRKQFSLKLNINSESAATSNIFGRGLINFLRKLDFDYEIKVK